MAMKKSIERWEKFNFGWLDYEDRVIFQNAKHDILELHAEVQRLRRDCAEAYQIMGAVFLGEPVPYTEADALRALDNISAAANGLPRPHDDLLPWPKQGECNEQNR